MADQHHIRLSISGMSCAGCVTAVETALLAVPGVTEASVNLADRSADVNGSAAPQALVAAIEAAGYDAAELKGIDDEAIKQAAEHAHYRRLWRNSIVAAAVGVPLFIAGLWVQLVAVFVPYTGPCSRKRRFCRAP